MGRDPDVADPFIGKGAGRACAATVDEHLADETGQKRSSSLFLIRLVFLFTDF